jgi:hypothetical protein
LRALNLELFALPSNSDFLPDRQISLRKSVFITDQRNFGLGSSVLSLDTEALFIYWSDFKGTPQASVSFWSIGSL